MKCSLHALVSVVLGLLTAGVAASPVDLLAMRLVAETNVAHRENGILAATAHTEGSIVKRSVHEEIPDLRRSQHDDIPQLG